MENQLNILTCMDLLISLLLDSELSTIELLESSGVIHILEAMFSFCTENLLENYPAIVSNFHFNVLLRWSSLMFKVEITNYLVT